MLTVCMPIGSSHGWGICGKNLIKAFSGLGVEHEVFTDQNMRAIDRQNAVINCLRGPDFEPAFPVRGTRNVAYGFIESLGTAKLNLGTAEQWDKIVCGSTWMRDRLADMGLKHLSVAVQGVDHSIFNEDQRCHDPNVFKVFIGGKLESRKGQDIAIAAAKVLLQKHSDVKLVLAINNPWPQSLATIRQSTLIAVPDLSGKMHDVVERLMAVNGIGQGRWEYIEGSNEQMAALYGQCNCGLFMSRCEGGSNLVLSEAMATGLPCIVNYATGQLDAADYDSAICLTDGKELCDGWVEPCFDSVVWALEWCYAYRSDAMAIGLRGGRFARRLKWGDTAKELLSAVAA